MWLVLFLVYLAIGLFLVTCTRVRKDMLASTIGVRTSSNPLRLVNTPLWKVVAFFAIVSASAVLLWPLFLPSWFRTKPPPRPNHTVPKGWLKRRLTVELAESEHMVLNPHLGTQPIPFGFRNRVWREFIANMREDDELWEYSSPDHFYFWEHFAGRAGIALVRDGEVVDSITTALN